MWTYIAHTVGTLGLSAMYWFKFFLRERGSDRPRNTSVEIVNLQPLRTIMLFVVALKEKKTNFISKPNYLLVSLTVCYNVPVT